MFLNRGVPPAFFFSLGVTRTLSSTTNRKRLRKTGLGCFNIVGFQRGIYLLHRNVTRVHPEWFPKTEYATGVFPATSIESMLAPFWNCFQTWLVRCCKLIIFSTNFSHKRWMLDNLWSKRKSYSLVLIVSVTLFVSLPF